jgi:hypothetical protein
MCRDPFLKTKTPIPMRHADAIILTDNQSSPSKGKGLVSA